MVPFDPERTNCTQLKFCKFKVKLGKKCRLKVLNDYSIFKKKLLVFRNVYANAVLCIDFAAISWGRKMCCISTTVMFCCVGLGV